MNTTVDSAGVDLRACIDNELIIATGDRLIPTVIAIHIAAPKLVATISPQSGLGHKHGIREYSWTN